MGVMRVSVIRFKIQEVCFSVRLIIFYKLNPFAYMCCLYCSFVPEKDKRHEKRGTGKA